MADAVLPLVVDRVDHWSDLAPNAAMRMLARGVVLTSPADAARAYPDLFVSPGAASAQRSREKAFLLRSPIETLIGERNGNHAAARLVYRPPGRGQQDRRAWLRAGGAALVDKLKLIGRKLAVFQVEHIPPDAADLPDVMLLRLMDQQRREGESLGDDNPVGELLRRFTPPSNAPLGTFYEIDCTDSGRWAVSRVYVRREPDGLPTQGVGSHLSRDPDAQWIVRALGRPLDEQADEAILNEVVDW